MSIERAAAPGLLERFRYFVWTADPGLQQLKHGAKTVLAVVVALEVFQFSKAQSALYAGMSAGFLMQSTAGLSRKARQVSMAGMGVASTVAVGLGSELADKQWAKQLLLVAAAFLAYYVRRWIHGRAMFPLFAFVLTLLATVQPGGAGNTLPMMEAVFTGFIAAFAVNFYLFPDETAWAFRHAADLFLLRLSRAMRNPSQAQADLLAMHRSVAFEEEEREYLGDAAPAECDVVLRGQYEALQVLTLLVDMQKQGSATRAVQAAAEASRTYMEQVSARLRQAQRVLNQ